MTKLRKAKSINVIHLNKAWCNTCIQITRAHLINNNFRNACLQIIEERGQLTFSCRNASSSNSFLTWLGQIMVWHGVNEKKNLSSLKISLKLDIIGLDRQKTRFYDNPVFQHNSDDTEWPSVYIPCTIFLFFICQTTANIASLNATNCSQ